MTRVLLIVGNGFSGSTLLAFLLNAHPDMMSAGELTGPHPDRGDPAEYRCSCGATVGTCPFWADVFREMADRGHPLSPGRWDTRIEVGRGVARHLLSRTLLSNTLDRIRDRAVLHAPGSGPHVRHRIARNAALFATLAHLAQARVVVDSTKDPRRWAYLRRSPDLDVRVLHLVRDIPGQAASARHNSGRSTGEAARLWLHMQRQVERLARRLPPEHFLRVHYETLCTDTAGTLDRIALFAGVAPYGGPVDFRAVEHHIMGNRMRLGTSSEVRLDQKWRDRLSPPEVADLLERTAAVRRTVGYGPEPHVPAP
jgi:hypothetical protein